MGEGGDFAEEGVGGEGGQGGRPEDGRRTEDGKEGGLEGAKVPVREVPRLGQGPQAAVE